MSLTSVIDDKASPLHNFLVEHLPSLQDVRKAYRAARPTQRAAVLPSPDNAAKPSWGTLGAAIDHRLRLSLSAAIPRTGSVRLGVDLAGMLQPALRLVGNALLDDLEKQAVTHALDDRTRPLSRSAPTEDRLARACYAAALFEEVFRTGRIWPETPLGRAHDALSLEALLAQVPAYAASDICAVTTLAEQGLAAVREATTPASITLAPTFTGSVDVGGADADWIADRLLIDVKATKDPNALPGRDIYQLAGYALLDYRDAYRIDRVGWYHARTGSLSVWAVEEFFSLLGAREPLPVLRARTESLLGSSRTQ